MRILDRRAFMQQSAGLAGLISTAGYFLHDSRRRQSQRSRPSPPPRQRTAQYGRHRRAAAAAAIISRGLAGRHNCVSPISATSIPPSRGSGHPAQKQQGSGRPCVQDLRRIMDNKDIHIVTIATPNHWHSLAAIWAMQAGKHVYVEKPVSHNVSEGRRLSKRRGITTRFARPARKSAAIPASVAAIEFSSPASSASCKVARGLCYKSRPSHRPWRRRAATPRTDQLRSLVRPRRQSAASSQSAAQRHRPLRLALDLGLRQRRSRQPGHPPDGRRPLGPGQERTAPLGHQPRRPLRLHRRRRNRQHADRRLRLRQRRADLRSPRPAHRALPRRRRSAMSSIAPTAIWSSPVIRQPSPST